MVSEMRVPSSSSSSSTVAVSLGPHSAFLSSSIAYQQYLAWCEHLPPSVRLLGHRHPSPEGSSSRRECWRMLCDLWGYQISQLNVTTMVAPDEEEQRVYETMLQRSLPVPLAPQTIKQNWIPFLTFFFRRILIWSSLFLLVLNISSTTQQQRLCVLSNASRCLMGLKVKLAYRVQSRRHVWLRTVVKRIEEWSGTRDSEGNSDGLGVKWRTRSYSQRVEVGG